ncbi:hypothetical protein ACFQ0B_76220 [Nonomuraea thailandensis]
MAITFVLTRSVAPPAPAVRPTPSVSPFASPVEQVWPNAVHEIPGTVPGGQAFVPQLFASSRVVVGHGIDRKRLDSVWSYDIGSRRFTNIVPPNGFTGLSLAFGDGYLAWWAVGNRKAEIWVVPVTGGVPRRLASVDGRMSSYHEAVGAGGLAIADDAVVWSPGDGGVYRLPLKGGKPTLMSGTRGLYLVEWPWAGSPRDARLNGPPIPRPMERLKNVLTGEIRDATAPAGRTSWDECGVTWCLRGMEAWRRDGTDFRVLPGHGRSRSNLYAGRYVLLRQHDRSGKLATAVHDLATGSTGLLFRKPEHRGHKSTSTLGRRTE